MFAAWRFRRISVSVREVNADMSRHVTTFGVASNERRISQSTCLILVLIPIHQITTPASTSGDFVRFSAG